MPLQCEFFALEGLSQLLKTVEQVREQLNPDLTIHGIVLTMYDARNNLSGQVVADVREFMGRESLRHHHSAQCAGLGSAVLRQAGAGLRSQMQRQRSLSAARHRNHPARKRITAPVEVSRCTGGDQETCISKRGMSGVTFREGGDGGGGSAIAIGPRTCRADRRRRCREPRSSARAASGACRPTSLRPNARNPRRIFSDAELDELAASLRERGIIQPIVVRPMRGATDAYEIIAGERRWRAAQRAGLHEVPVVIIEATDARSAAACDHRERAAHRSQSARRGRRLSGADREFSHSQDDIAKIVGKSRSHVANTLRLLKLPDQVKAYIIPASSTAGHAAHADRPAQCRAARGRNRRARSQRAPGRGDRAAAKRGSNDKPRSRKRRPRQKTPIRGAGKASCPMRLVSWSHRSSRRHGVVSIRYRNLDQLDDLAQRLENKRH